MTEGTGPAAAEEPSDGPTAVAEPAVVVGVAVRDTASDRVGLVMGREGPYLQLRPLGGGREWDADPARVERVGPAELLHVRVAEANARSSRGGPG
jgi:hypothetical protein